ESQPRRGTLTGPLERFTLGSTTPRSGSRQTSVAPPGTEVWRLPLPGAIRLGTALGRVPPLSRRRCAAVGRAPTLGLRAGIDGGLLLSGTASGRRRAGP